MRGPCPSLSAEQPPSAPLVLLVALGKQLVTSHWGEKVEEASSRLWACGCQAPKGEQWVFCEDGKCSRVFSRTSAHVFGFRSDLCHLDWFPPNHPNLQLPWLSCAANSLCNCSTTQLRSFTVSSRIKTWRQCFLTLTSAVTVPFKLAARPESKVFKWDIFKRHSNGTIPIWR